MIHYKKGDLLELAKEGKFQYIIHGCNCFNTMGAGIAAQIAKKFPSAERTDSVTRSGSNRKLGDYTIAVDSNNMGKPLYIVNAYTQYKPGADFKLFALEMFLWRFKQDYLLPYDDGLNDIAIKIGVPWIGCGIGGGKKSEVKRVLYQFAASTPLVDLTIVEYKP